jgi:hypothetical protein
MQTHLETALDELPQLLRLLVAGVLNLDGATLRDNLLGSVGTAGEAPSGVGPPLLQLSNFLLELSLLVVSGHDVGGDGVCGGGGGSDGRGDGRNNLLQSFSQLEDLRPSSRDEKWLEVVERRGIEEEKTEKRSEIWEECIISDYCQSPRLPRLLLEVK